MHRGALPTQALHRSLAALIVPTYMLAVNCMFFAGVLYACEAYPGRSSAAGDSAVLSLPDAIWLTFITMTTVGYGDFSPTSDGGRAVTVCATLAGLVNIALPLAIVGENFIEVWQSRQLDHVITRIRDVLHVRQVSDCVHAFQAFDPKGSGWIDWVRFRRGVRRHLKLNFRISQLFEVWTRIDKSGSGRLPLAEFCEARGATPDRPDGLARAPLPPPPPLPPLPLPLPLPSLPAAHPDGLRDRTPCLRSSSSPMMRTRSAGLELPEEPRAS